MKKIFLIIFLFLSSTCIYSQCQSGDCSNGYGVMKYTEGTYQGEFINSIPNGLGIFFYTNGNYYLGEFISGNATGKGAFVSKTEGTFIGEWKNLKQNGIGIYRDIKGNTKMAGFYTNGKNTSPVNDITNPNNPTNCNGNCYDGYGYIQKTDKSFVQAIHKDGKAIFGRVNNSTSTFDGDISNNLANGYGQIKYTDGNHYFGYFKDGKKHGKGISSDPKNNRTIDEWKNGVLLDKTKFDFKQEDFCNQLIDFSKLNKDERKKLKTGTRSYNNHTLEKKFLNIFEVRKDLSYSTDDVLTIKFPAKDRKKPTLSMDQLKETTKKCTGLKGVGYNKYKYKDTEVAINFLIQPELKIIFPIINPCISGDCVNGYGKKKYHNAVYEGYFQLGERTGYGKMTYDGGKQYEGDYRNDKRHGKGIFTFPNGERIESMWKNNSANGPGKKYDSNGNIVFEGEYKNGKTIQ